MPTRTPELEQLAQTIAEDIMGHLQAIEAHYPDIKKVIKGFDDTLAADNFKRVKRSQAECHQDWWNVCRALGLNEGGK